MLVHHLALLTDEVLLLRPQVTFLFNEMFIFWPVARFPAASFAAAAALVAEAELGKDWPVVVLRDTLVAQSAAHTRTREF